MKFSLIILFLVVAGCASRPQLPSDFQGKAAIVMGYSTDWVEGDHGGNVYTGMRLDKLNGIALAEPLARYDYVLVDPGDVRVQGECWWRLRGTMTMEDDLLEAVDYHFIAKANYIYTLSLQVDDYKAECRVDNFEQQK